MKIMTVLGARPQFVKAAVLSRWIQETSGCTEIIVHTGQHFDSNMSDIFFEQMNIPKPHFQLGISSMDHGAMTGVMMQKLEPLLLEQKPDLLLVYGDTNSTLAGALTAVKQHIPIAHIEAGLRSFNMNMPEEVNRVLTDRVSDHLFCPTEQAVHNLQAEGFDSQKVHNVGDIMYDASLYYRSRLKPSPDFVKSIEKLDQPLTLITLHRQENTDSPERLQNICSALNTLSQEHSMIFPVHPRTRKKMKDLELSLPNIRCIEPVGFAEMLYLLNKSQMVMTDSGGVQKEAFFFQRPCITLRDETEWVETVNVGANRLVGADKDKIIDSYLEMAQNNINFDQPLYGQGDCGQKILSILRQ